jgi:crossover junction endodeoxyribonuclease RusA
MAIIGLRKIVTAGGKVVYRLSGPASGASSRTIIGRGIRLDYPPTANTYYRHLRQFGGRTVISKAGKEYRESVARHIAALGVSETLRCRLELAVDVYPPDRRKRRDLDNLTKSLCDALQYAGVYEDDSQIDKLVLERMRPEKPGKVVIRLEVYDAAHPKV